MQDGKIEITEREPFAIWQKEGKLLVVATDGTPIQELQDQRFTDLAGLPTPRWSCRDAQ